MSSCPRPADDRLGPLAASGGADVWLVRYEGQPQETAVKEGENRGVTVVYRNVAVGPAAPGDLVRPDAGVYALPAGPAEDADLKSWPCCCRPAPAAGSWAC